jgi:hypothetical protein
MRDGDDRPDRFMPRRFASAEQVSAAASRSFEGRLFETDGTML